MWKKFGSCVKGKASHWSSLDKADGQRLRKKKKKAREQEEGKPQAIYCRKGKCTSFIGIGGPCSQVPS